MVACVAQARLALDAVAVAVAAVLADGAAERRDDNRRADRRWRTAAAAAFDDGRPLDAAAGPGSRAGAGALRWRHHFTNATYAAGARATVAGPLSEFPLFHRVPRP